MTLAGFAMMEEVYPSSQSYPVAERMPTVRPVQHVPPAAGPVMRRKKNKNKTKNKTKSEQQKQQPPVPHPSPSPSPVPASTLTLTGPQGVWIVLVILLVLVVLLLWSLMRTVSLNQQLSNLLAAQSYMRPTFQAVR